MKDGFLRVAAVTPDIKVADCDHNADEIIKYAKEAARNDASVIVFPELCITGSTCGDLFLQKTLLDGAKAALEKIAKATAKCDAVIIVGMPYSILNGLSEGNNIDVYFFEIGVYIFKSFHVRFKKIYGVGTKMISLIVLAEFKTCIVFKVGHCLFGCL